MNGASTMLQISSGKFFKEDELHINQRVAVLYSNFKYHSIIETTVGRLEPIIYGNNHVETYLFIYENKMPKGGILIAAGDDEIIEQFIYLCSLKLKSIFSRDPELIRTYCINNPKEIELSNNPLSLVPNFFNQRNYGTDADVDSLKESVEKLIGLPRKMYSGLMACYQNIYHSLLHLNTNIDLAYSQLVYCLESLAQHFDQFIPTWDDYDQNVRVKLDILLSTIDNEELSNNIRDELIKSANLKSQARFINLILQNIEDSFFQDEAHEAKYAIKKLDLRVALINTYHQRSRFVHALGTMKKEAKMPRITIGEVFHEKAEPFLTYRGLIRLTLHVITNFIKTQPYLEKEEYNWHDDLPGLIHVNLSPQYWLGNTADFKQESALTKFEGFIAYVTSMIQNKKNVFEFDLRPLLELYEKLIPISRTPNKLDMYALYVLYHQFIITEQALPNYQATIEKYKTLFNECSIQAMVVALFKNDIWSWDANTSELIFIRYKKQSYKSKKLSLPNSIEIALILAVANLYLEENNELKFKELLVTAINQLPGFKKLQDKIHEHLNKCISVPIEFILTPEDNSSELSVDYYI